ncbi:MAG: hypothetical protein ACF8CQ_21610 [Rhodopirellula sp. JB044]|uniref:hypothetical protein n=1 Tax=Rhodopirellula sp. JB044 TaxID=3342844 RepID=UPI00370B92B9
MISFPKQDILQSWETINTYARQDSLTVSWDDDTQMLCVRGLDFDHDQVISDISALIFQGDVWSGQMTWDIGWRTSIQLGPYQYPLLIEGEPDDELSAIERHKAAAVSFIAANQDRWIRSIAERVYETYVEQFCDGAPCSRDAFSKALTITDCITFDPSSNKYEVYVNAGELLSPRLVHLIEIPGELFEIDLE